MVHHDADVLAHAIAARLISRLGDAQASRGHAHLVLTGGTIGIACLSALAESPARSAIDWSRVDLWWGDERFVAADDSERNEGQARRALIDHIAIPESQVHPMGASNGPAGDPEAAAADYAERLSAAAHGESELPHFDVVLLGIGPDGHVASLFPEHPALDDDRTVVAVHGSPKPPPLRTSLTFRALNSADEVWFLASGESKSRPVSLALDGAGRKQIPAAGVSGTRRTLWLLDERAAAELPPALRYSH